MSDENQLVNELTDLVGSQNVLTDPTALSVYECDGATLFKALPDMVVFPGKCPTNLDDCETGEQTSNPFHRSGRWHGTQRRNAPGTRWNADSSQST